MCRGPPPNRDPAAPAARSLAVPAERTYTGRSVPASPRCRCRGVRNRPIRKRTAGSTTPPQIAALIPFRTLRADAESRFVGFLRKRNRNVALGILTCDRGRHHNGGVIDRVVILLGQPRDQGPVCIDD